MRADSAFRRLCRASDLLRAPHDRPVSAWPSQLSRSASRRLVADWLTVVSPDGRDDLELSLEPNANPAAKAFQEAMFRQAIPLAAFEVDDIESEVRRLMRAGHPAAVRVIIRVRRSRPHSVGQ